MLVRLRRLAQGARQRPWLAFTAMVLLALIGFSLYAGVSSLVRSYHRRAVQAALDRRDFAAAQTRLAQCIAAWPNETAWRLLAARAARGEGDYAEADRQLAAFDRLGGNRQALALERALLDAQQGNLAHAEGYLLSSLREKPPETNLILEALAHGYLHTQRLAEAQNCLERWLQRQPDQVHALLLRGQVLEWWNDLEEAVASYRKAVAADPDNEKARRRLALALVRCDRAEEAIEQLEALARQPGDVEILLGLARGRRCLGQTEAARQLLDQVLALQPRHVEALSERGKLAMQTGQAAQALEPLEQALALAPHDRETNYTYYLCLQQLGRHEDATRVLRTVERIRADLQRVSDLRRRIPASPGNAALRCEIGIILLRNGQQREGLRWLESALHIDPHHHEARQALARYAQQKDVPR